MPTRSPTRDRPDTTSEGATALTGEITGENHISKTRVRRSRFGDLTANALLRPATGAIAVSFAVVSRNRWPR